MNWIKERVGQGKTRLVVLLVGWCWALGPMVAWGQTKVPELEQKMIARGLVDVQRVDPSILVELKYSTTDNFVKKDVYGDLTRAYLQPEMADRLARASKLLKSKHPQLRLLVYDAARPNSVQYQLWDALDAQNIPESRKPMYVANPKTGSNHNFGCAIDLTVADAAGKSLDMGTSYDYFGPLAYPRSEADMLRQGKLSKQQVANRQILRSVMTAAGFTVNTTEWWHFDGMSKKQARAKYGMIP
ncbi:D-alanyl-D-alanine dipeptidase [Dyadobacter jejuensis]|uniref:D-alanyl-D-alanine dipeptidase n=1 Tax=Dyadobacter jejuensis TaxID=1082580 RepID=A0A316AHR9_9BACT|nr:M15 family metallopeptidase [Dyadobacter jejuensis]PWJ57256.1 D-alanyl-D-alanine dipeptidase [Dyadobacter jejuensis]